MSYNKLGGNLDKNYYFLIIDWEEDKLLLY